MYSLTELTLLVFYFSLWRTYCLVSLLVSWCQMRLNPLGIPAATIVPAQDHGCWWVWSSRCNENCQGKLKYSEKTCLHASLCTTNFTWLDLGWNPGCHDGKLATNLLIYGMTNVLLNTYFVCIKFVRYNFSVCCCYYSWHTKQHFMCTKKPYICDPDTQLKNFFTLPKSLRPLNKTIT
jgi:hypothetical protein